MNDNHRKNTVPHCLVCGQPIHLCHTITDGNSFLRFLSERTGVAIPSEGEETLESEEEPAWQHIDRLLPEDVNPGEDSVIEQQADQAPPENPHPHPGSPANSSSPCNTANPHLDAGPGPSI